MDTDFGVLGTGPTSERLTWLADMQSAITASTLSQAGSLTFAAELYFAERGNGRGGSSSLEEGE
jgi:coproporphyrinogen III oxidase